MVLKEMERNGTVSVAVSSGHVGTTVPALKRSQLDKDRRRPLTSQPTEVYQRGSQGVSDPNIVTTYSDELP